MSRGTVQVVPLTAAPPVAETQPAGRVASVSLWQVLAWVGPALLALAARLSNGPLTVDDAYITFRYAENLRAGRGLVYNPGEAVLGTTTPLWAALLALLPLPHGSLPTAAFLLGAALDAATCLLLVWIGARLGGRLWVGSVAALVYALGPMSVAFSAGGMETPLFVLLLVGGFALWLRGNRATAIVVAALATLTRPEGVLLAALLLADDLRLRRRLPWRLVLLYATLLAPWALYATAVYGSPVPHSVAAKAVSYSVSPLLNLAAILFGAGLPGFSVLPLGQGLLGGAGALGLACLGLVLLICLARAGVPLALRAEPRALPLLLFAPLYALAYALAGLRGTRMFHWYLVPMLPFFGLYVALGLAALADRLRLAPRVAAPLACALVALWALPAFGLSRGWLDRPAYPVGLSLAREQAYSRIGATLSPTLGPEVVIAAPEIGALGYASGARILDTVGLVSPESTPYYPLPAEMLVADNAVPPALIQDRQPRYVVALDQFVRKSLLASDWFLAHYDLVSQEPAPVWDSDSVLVYRRNARP